VLKALRDWVLDISEDDAPDESDRAPDGHRQAEAESKEESRLSARHDFCGHRVVIRSRRTLALFHLKDLSCLGASGLTDLPVPVGAMVFVTLKKGRFHAAEVRWVRNVMVGLRFYRPLDPEMVERVHAAHVARKAAAIHAHQWELSGLAPGAPPA
jgi:hypothetical protein